MSSDPKGLGAVFDGDAGDSARHQADWTQSDTCPTVVIVGFDQDSKITYEHIYWDQATMLVQLGLLDPSALPVCGAEQSARVLDPRLPANTLIPKR